MEFFLSSMAVLLVAALIVFLILPRIGASVLVGLSIVLLLGCLYSHYTLFSSEYRFSTWQERLKWYGPFVMYGAVVVTVIMYLGYLVKGSPDALPTTNLAEAKNNTVVGVINNTAKATNDVVNNAIKNTNEAANQIANSMGLNGNNKVNNKSNNILSNLGGILNTPKRNNLNRL